MNSPENAPGRVNGPGEEMPPVRRVSDRRTVALDTCGLQLVSSHEAAKRLGICERTVWTLQNSGELPSVRIGRCIRFDLDDLCRWVEDRKRGRGQGR
jgi:excisionase family DNA binding protein